MEILTENDLINFGFEIVRFVEPNYHLCIDIFHQYDYAILKINKGGRYSDNLVIRFKNDKFILDNFYSVRFYNIHDIDDLIKSMSKIKWI